MVYALHNVDSVKREIHILPCQTENLPTPAVGYQKQVQQRPPFQRLMLRLLQNGVDFFLFKVIRFRFLHFRRLRSGCGIVWDKQLLLCVMPKGNGEILNYAEKLAADAGGAILQWIIDGAVMFCRNRFHLTIPYAIAVATQEYKQREDWLHLFLSECCTQEYGARIRCAELYNAYKEYAVSTGDYCRRLTDFNAAMETAGFKQLLKMGNKKFWIGIRLRGFHKESCEYASF